MQLKEIGLKQDRNFYMLGILFGVFLNFVVFSANGYSMPVKADFDYQDNNHFSYSDRNEVKMWLLSDWFQLHTKHRLIVFSLGDIIIVLNAFFLVYTLIRVILLKEEPNKKIKKEIFIKEIK